MNGLYVFGIADSQALSDHDALYDGLPGRPARVVTEAGLCAIITDAPDTVVEPTRRNMLSHTALLERAMMRAPILPMRFGTIAPDADRLTRCLRTNESAFRKALDGIVDRVELGVKASWREGVVYRDIIDRDPSLRAMRDRLQTRPVAETYQDRIELGRRVEAALGARREEECAILLQALSPLAESETALKAIDDNMILNRAFLVPHRNEDAFDRAIQVLGDAHAERISFRYVGPVPPYNFVTLRADWQAA